MILPARNSQSFCLLLQHSKLQRDEKDEKDLCDLLRLQAISLLLEKDCGVFMLQTLSTYMYVSSGFMPLCYLELICDMNAYADNDVDNKVSVLVLIVKAPCPGCLTCPRCPSFPRCPWGPSFRRKIPRVPTHRDRGPKNLVQKGDPPPFSSTPLPALSQNKFYSVSKAELYVDIFI